MFGCTRVFRNHCRFVGLVGLAMALTALPRGAFAAGYGNNPGFEATFGCKFDAKTEGVRAQIVGSNVPGNAFWPGDEAVFEFQVTNSTDQPIKVSGHWELIQYATSTDDPQPFAPATLTKLRACGKEAATFELPAKGVVQQKVKLAVPAEYGAYGVVLDLDGHGREVVAYCLRTVAATPAREQFPTYALDLGSPDFGPLYQRLGIKGVRIEAGMFNTDDPKAWESTEKLMKAMKDANIAVMVTMMGSGNGMMPLDRIRGYLNDKAEGKMEYPGDFAIMPQHDKEFQRWVKTYCERYGWPKGPVNAVELWNEPWEGMSISGWGADMPRYREMYTHMAQGVEEARKEGAQVLIGGACSSMNTEDKLFADGNDEPFLKWLDFTSIHYQPMCPAPAMMKRFAQRKSPMGPTRAWDTESWIANTEDRVAAVIASMRASGLDRTAGVLHDAVRSASDVEVKKADGTSQRVFVGQALAPAAAIAAVNAFIGQRHFNEILFRNGLPWIFVFDGIKNEEDGTVVVVGDLGGVYERRLLMYRGVLGLAVRKRAEEARAKMAALPTTATEIERAKARTELQLAEVLDKASLTVANDGHIQLLDFYGNVAKQAGDKTVVPLNGLGYFLRTDGSAGSFKKMLQALREARIDGLEPVDIVAHDLLDRVNNKPAFHLTITNILNRPVQGKLTVKLGELQLADANSDVSLKANETKELTFAVTGGAASPDNSYPLSVAFDAGADGKKTHDEAMHVNVISKTTINIDGDLSDWADVLPQPIRSTPGAGRNLTEKAWLPFVKFDEKAGIGYASGYMAYDDKYFYFAAKIADDTPYEGNVRFEKRDDDSYFYPETSYSISNGKHEELHWPAGVRRFSYRKDPDLPSGSHTDNVQIGFNVLPVEKTDWIAALPGTMPKFVCYKTTDYEYALNSVAEKFGGGTEVWRLAAPGVPRKHYYPRQPKVADPAKDGGPVHEAKLVMKRDGNVRLVECAMPWSEIPAVKEKLAANEPIKFTFRVNDDKGLSYELNELRSVSKGDSYALHDLWQSSWSVETEFAFEGAKPAAK